MNGRSRQEPLGYFSRQGQRSQEEIQSEATSLNEP